MLKCPLLEWNVEAVLIQEVSELPEWFNNDDLYLDLETTSEIDTKDSLNPWHNCKILGIAVIVDKEKYPIYIPLRHRGENHYKNLPVEPVLKWLTKVIAGSKRWVNQNLKYDAHVLAREGLDIREHPIKLVDTLVLLKMFPREERFTYELTGIMRDWFYIDISSYEERIKNHLALGEKDYGLIPIDEMCPYAAIDVLCVREIKRQADVLIPEECQPAFELELNVTPVLFDMEETGMKIDAEKVILDYWMLPMQMQKTQDFLAQRIGIPKFRAHTNADCSKYFITKLGLPVIEYTNDDEKKRKPSFGKDALLGYRAMRPDLEAEINAMMDYKENQKLWSSFTKSYLTKQVEQYIHSSYNQIVRTGRMSGKDPNPMQLSPAAKEYIIPEDPDRVIVDIDYSQIEFRLIAHFIQAEAIIKAYVTDPNADYHKIVAELCQIERYPAKRVNFMLGFGGGKGKCIEILSSDESIIRDLGTKEAIEARANEVYAYYHKMLPTLKPTTWRASTVMRQRGYVRTIMKRRRYLPRKAHFKAFNTVIQGSAADLFKAALVRAHIYCKQAGDIRLLAAVHDSIVFSMPKAKVSKYVPELCRVMEQLPEGISLRVPIRADAKVSARSWKHCDHCAECPGEMKYDSNYVGTCKKCGKVAA